MPLSVADEELFTTHRCNTQQPQETSENQFSSVPALHDFQLRLSFQA